MKRVVSMLILLATLSSGSVSAATLAAGSPVGLGCPTYPALLLRARDQLTQGDRASAIASLRRARAVLDDCRRQAEGETALAACDGVVRQR